jgi:hypothetical protein
MTAQSRARDEEVVDAGAPQAHQIEREQRGITGKQPIRRGTARLFAQVRCPNRPTMIAAFQAEVPNAPAQTKPVGCRLW